MIGFDELEVGAVVTVSDGFPQPVEEEAEALRWWRSNNFTGTVLHADESVAVFEVEGPLSMVMLSIMADGGHSFTPAAPTDEQLNRHFHAIVDAEAAKRMPELRPIYDRKLAEAQAGSGNLLRAEAAARGIPMAELAQMILDNAMRADMRAAAIEVTRIRAKLAVTEASGLEGKAAAADPLWP